MSGQGSKKFGTIGVAEGTLARPVTPFEVAAPAAPPPAAPPSAAPPPQVANLLSTLPIASPSMTLAIEEGTLPAAPVTPFASAPSSPPSPSSVVTKSAPVAMTLAIEESSAPRAATPFVSLPPTLRAPAPLRPALPRPAPSPRMGMTLAVDDRSASHPAPLPFVPRPRPAPTGERKSLGAHFLAAMARAQGRQATVKP